MGLGTVLLIILIVFLIGGLPMWPHMASSSWGWYPSGGVGVILLIVVVLLLMGESDDNAFTRARWGVILKNLVPMPWLDDPVRNAWRWVRDKVSS